MIDLDQELSGELAPLWVVYGDARPMVDAAVERLEAAGLERCGLPAFNHAAYRAADGDVVEALSTARTPPMMADLRLVVVRDLEQGDDEFFDALIDYAKSPSDTTLLVVTGEGFPKVRKGGTNWGARVRNAVKKTGRVLKLASKDVPASRFVQQEAERLGKQVPRHAADLLVEIVGDDLMQLRREVEKVALYVGDRDEVTPDDLHAACSLVAESVVWDLTAGLVAGDADQALAALHRQLQEGENPRRLLGLIAWQLRQILQAKDLLRQGRSDKAVRKAASMRWNTFREVKRSYEAGTIPPAGEVMSRLAVANRKMNQHRAGDRRILEALVLELCQWRA